MIEVAFDGRLGKAPELRKSTAGKAYKRLSVAAGRGESMEWVSVSAFDEVAGGLPPDLDKGERGLHRG
jgi:hypothetical protein